MIGRRHLLLSAAAAGLCANAALAAPGSTSITASPDAPGWAKALRRDLEAMAKALSRKLRGWQGPRRVLTPEAFGHEPGSPLSTQFIQQAIDSLAQRGGGTVRLSRGDYVSGTLELRSNIRLEIVEGARLLGSTNLAHYPDHVASRPTVMDSNMGMNQSLIFAENCQNICLAGKGTIDFRGTKTNFPGEQTVTATPGRPFGIRIIDCQGVHVRDLTMKDAACWLQNYLNCEDLLIEHITVHNQANHNNDGVDIDSCRRVIVRNCLINAEDDALCFKGAGLRATEDVLVENCRFYSSCNAIKFGTDSQGDFRRVLLRNIVCGGTPADLPALRRKLSDSGVSWEVVDGGTLEEVYTHNLHVERSESPLFLRLGDRGRVRPEMRRPGPGTLRRVVFETITGRNNGERGSYFLGLPDKLIVDVVLKDVEIEMAGTTRPYLAAADVPLMRSSYPDAWMIKGRAPAYGLWARDIAGLSLVNTRFTTASPDPRPAVELTGLDGRG